MAIKNILVPVDFSENSINGLSVACGFAKRFNAKLHLINAFHVPTPAADLGGAPQAIGTFISDYKDEIEESMEKLREAVPALNFVEHDEEVFMATAIDAIYTAMELKSIDLVIMGTKKSHTGLEHLLGGISTEVIRFAKCPVIVVPEQVHNLEPKNIALAIDYKEFDELERLNILADIAWEFNAKLSIVHIGPEEEPESVEKLTEMTELTDIFKDIDYTFESIHGKKIKERLINYVDEDHIDLVVMMPRKHKLFERIFEGSLTKRVAIDIHVPLLTIHE